MTEDDQAQTRALLSVWGRWVASGGSVGAQGYPKRAALVGATEAINAGQRTRLTARCTPTRPTYRDHRVACPDGVSDIDAAVSRLDPQQRAVLFARHVYGQPWETVARRMARTVNSARALEGQAVAVITYITHWSKP